MSTCTREWLDRELRATYAGFQAPIPRNWPDVLDMWERCVGMIDQNRVRHAFDRIVANHSNVKALTVNRVVTICSSRPKSVVDVIETTSAITRIRPAQIVGKTRKMDIVRARQIAMVLARETTGKSLAVIGRCFGGRDHATVRHALEKIAELSAKDEDIAATLSAVRVELGLH